MNTDNFALTLVSIADSPDLPRPDVFHLITSPAALPKPVPNVADSGRILFGASCRIPLQK